MATCMNHDMLFIRRRHNKASTIASLAIKDAFVLHISYSSHATGEINIAAIDNTNNAVQKVAGSSSKAKCTQK